MSYVNLLSNIIFLKETQIITITVAVDVLVGSFMKRSILILHCNRVISNQMFVHPGIENRDPKM